MELSNMSKGSESRSSSRSKARLPKGDRCSATYTEKAELNEFDDKQNAKLSGFQTYNETRAALKNLQDSLHCRNNCQANEHIQGQHQTEVFSLGVCEHRFCKSCVDSNDESICPVCSMPYRSTDVKVDKQLSNISALCISLSNILAGKTDEVVGDPQEAGSPVTNERHKQDKDTKVVIMLSKAMKGTESLSDVNRTPGKDNKDTNKTPDHPQRGQKRNSIKIKDSPCETNVPAKVLRGRNGIVTDSGKRNGSNQRSQKKNTEANENLDSLKTTENLTAQSAHLKQVTPNCKAGVRNVSNQRKMHSPSPASIKNSKEQRTPAGSRTGSMALLEKRNAKGESPLQVAALKANFQKVQELLLKGANPNVRDNAGWTPLHEAVNHSNVKITELLLDHGASVNAPALENDTPLHDAVSNYSLDCVKLLVRRGAKVMARNSRGQTALDLAQTEDMREALLVPDGINIAQEENIFMEEDIISGGRLCFVTSSISKEQLSSAQKCAKLLDAKLQEDHSAEVTHAINGVNAEGLCPRTLKYLNAILNGVWIVSPEWIAECLKQNKRVEEESFEVLGCITRGPCNAPQKARLNRLKKLPGLFDGCQFYFHGKFQYPTPSKDQLMQLAKLGGGIILTREPRLHNLDDYPYTVPYHAASTSSLSDCTIFVIYDDSCPNPPQVKAQRMSYLPASWLMDCIASFDLLEKTDYLKH